MGTVIDSLFSVLMSWVRALVAAIWALFTSERTTLLEFLGKNWIAIAVLLVLAGLVIDWLVWLVRWQPYHIWAMRVRRLLRIAPPEEDAPEEDAYAYAPTYEEQTAEEEAFDEELPVWLPLEQPAIGEEEAQQVLQEAEQVPDEMLGQYPGMRYDSAAAQEDMSSTRRYGAVHAEGPGAAEVSRRRAEIDAWQMQMQEEARQRAQAERAAREAEQARFAQEAYEAEQARLAQEAYEAEQARLAQEAYEAEQARLAQEAYEAEQARLAQEEYERQLVEYERQKAQYERELAEYERQKAEYEAALARQAQQEDLAMTRRIDAVQEMEAAQEGAPIRRASRRRNAATYSDYVEGEGVEELPAPPAWTQMESPAPHTPTAQPKAEKKSLLRSGMNKVAQMMEPEQEDVIGITSLPPRVDVHTAYRPAKKPPKGK